VYIMKNMANGYYKVGRSISPQARERTLQAMEPDVRLLAVRATAPERSRGCTEHCELIECAANGSISITAISTNWRASLKRTMNA